MCMRPSLGQVIRLEGEGLPRLEAPSLRGDWYITIAVEFPDVITNAQLPCML
jgi:DnaJ-class molecular chaperone